MRLISLLLLLVNVSVAQTPVQVVGNRGNVLAHVTIFEADEKNIFVGVTDSVGKYPVATIKESAQYVFHLLGYEDKLVSGAMLLRTPKVILHEKITEVKGVDIGKTRYSLLNIRNLPGKGGFMMAESNNIKRVIERVTPIALTKAGFIESFSLFVNQRKPGNARIFRFIIYNSENGKPTTLFSGTGQKGVLKKGKMIFHLSKNGIYLEKGTYFMGYETITNPDVLNENSEQMIFVQGKTSKQPKTLVRSNLNTWTTMSNSSREKEGTLNYSEICYELGLRVAVND